MQRYTIFFIPVSAVHVSSSISAHHQELKNCTWNIGTCQTCVLLLLARLNQNWFWPNQASGNNTQVWQVPMLHVQFLSSWWWAEKPLETCRALTTLKNIVLHCILLVVLKNRSKHVTLLDTQILLSKYTCVFTDTVSVCYESLLSWHLPELQ
jgi:hypothetical protein